MKSMDFSFRRMREKEARERETPAVQPEPAGKYDPSFCSTKRLTHLQKAHDQRFPKPAPPETGYRRIEAVFGPNRIGTPWATPRNKRKLSSKMARALNYQARRARP